MSGRLMYEYVYVYAKFHSHYDLTSAFSYNFMLYFIFVTYVFKPDA